MQPGRSCPLHYRYAPADLSCHVEPAAADVLYVVGGLYGNPFALEHLLAMKAEEEALGRSVRLLFNGDFNWFNVHPNDFRRINETVLAHSASLGNVEYEIADPSGDAGCGCGYPEFVDDQVVERSNRIMGLLQQTARDFPLLTARLRELPRYRCVEMAGRRLAVVHGDPASLAGWGLSLEALRLAAHQAHLEDWFRQADVDLFASSHSCLPALKCLEVDGRSRVVINNGSAGMGNFKGDPRGLITRIALDGFWHPEALYGTNIEGLQIEAVPLAFDVAAWQAHFRQSWPPGSDADESYCQRIGQGTDLAEADALL